MSSKKNSKLQWKFYSIRFFSKITTKLLVNRKEKHFDANLNTETNYVLFKKLQSSLILKIIKLEMCFTHHFIEKTFHYKKNWLKFQTD